MEARKTETLLAAENQQEAAEVMTFLGELNAEEKKDFLLFVQGIRFARGLAQSVAPQG